MTEIVLAEKDMSIEATAPSPDTLAHVYQQAAGTAAYGEEKVIRLYVNSTWTKDTCPEEFNREKLTWGKNAFAGTREISVPADNSYMVFLVDGAEAASGKIDIDGLFKNHNVIGYQSQVFAGTVRNTVDKKGTANSVRDLDIKARGSFVVDHDGDKAAGNDAYPVIVNGYENVKIDGAQTPVGVAGGAVKMTASRKITPVATDSTDIATSVEKISVTASAGGKLEIGHAAIAGARTVEPEKCLDADGNELPAESLTAGLSHAARNGLRMAMNSRTSFKEVVADNAVLDGMAGGAYSVSATIDATRPGSKKEGSSLRVKLTKKSDSRLKATDSTFNSVVSRFGDVDIDGGSFAGFESGTKKVDVSFKSDFYESVLTTAEPTDEERKILDSILSGTYRPVARQNFKVTDDSATTMTASGKIVVKGAVGGSIDCFKNVELNGSTVGDLDLGTETSSCKEKISFKQENKDVVRTITETHAAAGSLKATNSVMDKVTGVRKAEISFDKAGTWTIGSIDSSDKTMPLDEENMFNVIKAKANNGIATVTIEKTQSMKINGKVKISALAEDAVVLAKNDILAKDVTLIGNISANGMGAGSVVISASTVRSDKFNTLGVGKFNETLPKETTVETMTTRSAGKLTYDGSGKLAGDIDRFANLSLTGATIASSFNSVDYSASSTNTVSGEKEKPDAQTMSMKVDQKAKGKLDITDALVVADVNARGIKSATISGLNAENGKMSLFGGNITGSSTDNTANMRDDQDGDIGKNGKASSSATYSAAGSAKIGNSKFGDITGLDKVVLTGSTIGTASRHVVSSNVGKPVAIGHAVDMPAAGAADAEDSPAAGVVIGEKNTAHGGDMTSGKYVETKTMSTEKDGKYIETVTESFTARKGGSFTATDSRIDTIDGFQNVKLVGGAVNGGILNNDCTFELKTREFAWDSYADYKEKATPAKTETDTAKFKASGKLSMEGTKLADDCAIDGFASVDIECGDGKPLALHVSGIRSGVEDRYTKLVDGKTIEETVTIKAIGSLKLKNVDVSGGECLGFKTVDLAGSMVTEAIIGGGEAAIVRKNGKLDGVGTTAKFGGSITLSSTREKDGGVVFGSYAYEVIGFATVNLKGKDVRVGTIGGQYDEVYFGVGKVNVNGIASIGMLRLDKGADAVIKVSGKGSVLTLYNVYIHCDEKDAQKTRLDVASGAALKVNANGLGMKQMTSDMFGKSNIAGELCINGMFLADGKAGDSFKLSGKITTSDANTYKKLAEVPFFKDKVFYIGSNDNYMFEAYMGETLENADNDMKHAAELTLNKDLEMDIRGWLNETATDGHGFNCITDEVDYYEFNAGQFDNISFIGDEVNVMYSLDGKDNFEKIDWRALKEEDQKNYLAAGGYFKVSLKDSKNGPNTYVITSYK
ncbi:MAG: hypothetical protein MJ025_04570 [Victivallaceae bacterium]|nr:hypothetical protein [Victivallaceae bacterium]